MRTGRGAALAALCLLGGAARAEPPSPSPDRVGASRPAPPRAAVRLQLGDCVPAAADVRRLFAIELDVQLLTDGATEAAEVQARCLPGSGWLELRVDDPITGKSLQRSIHIEAAPPRARPRLLALALAELLVASWTELALGQPPALPTAAPPPAAPPPPAAGPVRRPVPAELRHAVRSMVRRRLPALGKPTGLRLVVGGASQVFVQNGSLLAGAALRLGGDHGHRLGWSVDATYQHARGDSPLGSLGADAVTGCAALFYQHGLGRFTLRAGGGLRAGAARLAGVPAEGARAVGASLWGALVGPALVLSASLALPRRLLVDLTLEGGYLLTPLYGRVGGERAVSLEGPWLALQLGLGVSP